MAEETNKIKKDNSLKNNKVKDSGAIEKAESQINELTTKYVRALADLKNYSNHADREKQRALNLGRSQTIMQILPIFDTVEQAIKFVPDDLKDNNWVKGIINLNKSLDKILSDLKIDKIVPKSGDKFDPSTQEAVQFDDSGSGETEVVAETLMAGYRMDNQILRHAMVKVKRQ